MSVPQTMTRSMPAVLPALRANWMLLLALYPLGRFLLLAEPSWEMSGFQRAERFLWLSFWLVEIAVVVRAHTNGFSLANFLKGLPPRAKTLVAVWLAALLWSTASAEHPSIALRNAAGWLMHAYVAAAVWHMFSRDDEAASQFSRFARVAPWIIVAVGILGLALVYRIGLHSDFPFATDTPGFAHIRHTGYIFAPAIILSIGCIAADGRRSAVAIMALALSTGLCLWFGSRGPFFGIACGLGTAFVLFAEFRKPALIARVGCAMAGGALLSVLVPSPDNGGFNAVKRLFESSPKPAEFSSGRSEFWKETVALIQERPILGYGGEHFQVSAAIAQNMYRHPHDFVLQALFEWGILGGGAFLLAIALALLAAWRRHRHGALDKKLALFGAVSMLCFALLDGVLFYSYTTFITLMFLGYALASDGSSSAPAAQRPGPA